MTAAPGLAKPGAAAVTCAVETVHGEPLDARRVHLSRTRPTGILPSSRLGHRNDALFVLFPVAER